VFHGRSVCNASNIDRDDCLARIALVSHHQGSEEATRPDSSH
jgi:hypothetical protein